MECSKCGISGTKTPLYDVITINGLFKLCEKCSKGGDFPVIRKPTVFQLKEAKRRPTVYETLSRMAGVKADEKRIEKPMNLQKQETSLREVVDRNYKEKFGSQPGAQPNPELMHNFHWVLMRVRRSKKITQKQIADAIGEPEAAIKMAEQGILPKDNDKLISKLQNYLGINLTKDGKPVEINVMNENPSAPKKISFDNEASKVLTVADLKKMKEEKERNAVFPETDFKELEDDFEKADLMPKPENTGKNPQKNKEDLSDEEIKRIIFKK